MDQLHYKKDDTNVVAITMDMEGPVNLMNAAFAPLLAEVVTKLEDCLLYTSDAADE